MTATTPWETPYAFAGNNPIGNIDWLGLKAVGKGGSDSNGPGDPPKKGKDGGTLWNGSDDDPNIQMLPVPAEEVVIDAKNVSYHAHVNLSELEMEDAGEHSELIPLADGTTKDWADYQQKKEKFIKESCGDCSFEDAMGLHYESSGAKAADDEIRKKEVLGKLGWFADGFAQIGSVVGPGGGTGNGGIVRPNTFRAGSRPKMDLGAARARQQASSSKIDIDQPNSLWGKTGDDIINHFEKAGFTNSTNLPKSQGGYVGRSTAIKLIRDGKGGRTTIIVNYGGGRNGGAVSSTPVYYKIQGPGLPKTKIIGPNYPGNWKLDKSFRIIEGTTGKILKDAGTILE